MGLDKRRQRLAQYFFFAVLLTLLWKLAGILAPFFVAALGAVILALVIYPAYRVILTRVQHSGAAAAVTTLLALAIIVVPILLVIWVFVREAPNVQPAAKAWLELVRHRGGASPEASQANSLWSHAENVLSGWNIDIEDIVSKNVDQFNTEMAYFATRMIRDALMLVANLLVLSFSLFFFLRDGPEIVEEIKRLVPMSQVHKLVVLQRVEDTLYAVLRGLLIVSLAQGFLTGVGFWLFHVPFPVLLGALTAMLSPIPFVGSAGVWGTVAVCLYMAGLAKQALYVCLWNLVVIGLVDQFLRPILIGPRAKIPVLLLFFGMLGGIHAYGFAGLMIGPLIVALALAFINIYRQQYDWLLETEDLAD